MKVTEERKRKGGGKEERGRAREEACRFAGEPPRHASAEEGLPPAWMALTPCLDMLYR